MNKLISLLVFVSFFLFSTNSFAYNSDPKIFIQELVDDAIETLSDKDVTKADKKKKLKLLLLKM